MAWHSRETVPEEISRCVSVCRMWNWLCILSSDLSMAMTVMCSGGRAWGRLEWRKIIWKSLRRRGGGFSPQSFDEIDLEKTFVFFSFVFIRKLPVVTRHFSMRVHHRAAFRPKTVTLLVDLLCATFVPERLQCFHSHMQRPSWIFNKRDRFIDRCLHAQTTFELCVRCH